MHSLVGHLEISRTELGRRSGCESAAALDCRSDGVGISTCFVRCTLGSEYVWASWNICIRRVLGFADVDALVISMAKNAGVQVTTGIVAQAIAIGVLTNMILKFFIGVLVGGKEFRRIVGIGLAAVALASAISLVLLR